MSDKIDLNKLRDASLFWKGKESIITMEECGELLQAIGKLERKGITDETLSNVKVEIRDVIIVLGIIMTNFEIDISEIIGMVNEKLGTKKDV